MEGKEDLDRTKEKALLNAIEIVEVTNNGE